MEYITIQKVHYNAVHYSSVHYNTVQYNAVHYNTVHRNIYVVYYSIVCPSINYCPRIIHSFYKNTRQVHHLRNLRNIFRNGPVNLAEELGKNNTKIIF